MLKKYSNNKKLRAELSKNKKQGKIVIEKPTKNIIYLKHILINFKKIIIIFFYLKSKKI